MICCLDSEWILVNSYFFYKNTWCKNIWFGRNIVYWSSSNHFFRVWSRSHVGCWYFSESSKVALFWSREDSQKEVRTLTKPKVIHLRFVNTLLEGMLTLFDLLYRSEKFWGGLLSVWHLDKYLEQILLLPALSYVDLSNLDLSQHTQTFNHRHPEIILIFIMLISINAKILSCKLDEESNQD